MSATLSTPVAWRDDRHDGLNGIFDFSLPPELLAVDATVKDLIAVLNQHVPSDSTTQRYVRGIELYGERLHNSYRVSSLMLQLSSAVPRLVVRTRPVSSDRIVLTVRQLTNQTVTLDCDPRDTGLDLKTRIREVLGVPEDQQRVIYGGKMIEDDTELTAYGITTQDEVQLVLRLRGGGYTPGTMFADVSNNTLLEVQSFSQTAPSWRIVDKGLNVEGRCEYQQCSAYGQMVISPRKFQAFNLITDTIHCPSCYMVVKPITCGFYDCTWKYEGVRSHGQCLLTSQWKAADEEQYHRFDADETHGSVSWDGLMIIAKPKSFSEAAKLVSTTTTASATSAVAESSTEVVSSTPQDEVCSICWSSLGSTGVAQTSCSHRFHGNCITQWSDWCERESKSATCPLCRTVIQTTN